MRKRMLVALAAGAVLELVAGNPVAAIMVTVLTLALATEATMAKAK